MDMLHALETFIRVVETGSLSAVARERNINHSAITRLVAQLEEHFRARLFHRTTRHLSLTEDGQNLLDHARVLIDVAADLEDTLGGQRTAPNGSVRVGLSATAARLLTPRLADLLGPYPDLSVEFVVREQFHDLIEDRLDVALRLGQPTDATLVIRSIGTFGRALVAAPSYLENRGAPSSPADLQGHSCIVHDVGPASANWGFIGSGGSCEIEVTSPFRTNSTDVVRQAALEGHGIALMFEIAALDDILAGRLCRLLPDYPTERAQLFLVYPSRRHLARRTRVVIDFLVEQFKVVGSRLVDKRVCADREP
jgi:DNA-binding transcriptional LysR family regulator